MIPILVGLFFARWLLNRPAAAPFRAWLTGLLGLTITTTGNAVSDAVYYTWATIRIAFWTFCAYGGLLLVAHFIGTLWEPWFFLALLVLGVAFTVTSAWVLQTLRYPVAEIAARFNAFGTGIWNAVPFAPELPDWTDPGKIKGGWKILALLGWLIHQLASGAWVLFSIPLKGLAGIITGFGILAEIADKTLRWLARRFATLSLVLLFLTAVSLVDAKYGTRVLDTWTLALLALLATLGITMGILAASRLEENHRAIPATAALTGLLTGIILLGLLWAHLDPRGAYEMVRGFRNFSDICRTYARIGNDAGAITTKAYWRIRANTVLRPCASCTVAEDGRLRGTVGAPVAHEEGQPLASMATEQPFEVDGVFWMRVALPYDWKHPELGYDFGLPAVWIAPKDFLEGAAKPVDLKPSAPLQATGAGFVQALYASSPLLMVGFTLVLLGLTMFGLGSVGKRVFSPRPNPAAAGNTAAAASTTTQTGGDGPHPLFYIALAVLCLPWVAFILLNGLTIIAQAGKLGNVNWSGPGGQLLTTVMLGTTTGGLILVAIVLAIFGRRGIAVILLLLALMFGGATAALAEGPVKPVSAGVYTPAGRVKPPTSPAPKTTAPTPPVAPAQASSAAPPENLLQIVDEELARYPELADHRQAILALISNESAWNPNAKNPNSSASGLMQLVEATRTRYGVRDDPFDPRQNVRGGLAFLADLNARYQSDLPKMLLAYAWGPENVPPEESLEASMAEADRKSPESSTAVRRVLARASRQLPPEALASYGIGAMVSSFAAGPTAQAETAEVGRNGGWRIRAQANRVNTLHLTLPAGRYVIVVATSGGITWDTNAPPIWPDADMVKPHRMSRPEEFPIRDLGVGKPVLLTSVGKIGLTGAEQTLTLEAPTTLEGVVQNNRPQTLARLSGQWTIYIIPKEG